jgi:hypothetical protein
MATCTGTKGKQTLERISTMQDALVFYDAKTRRRFSSRDWRLEPKLSDEGRVRYFAVSETPSGSEAWRAVGDA